MANDNLSSIETVLPPFEVKTNPIQGEIITIKPVTMRHFKDLIKVTAPIFDGVKELKLNDPKGFDNQKLQEFIEANFDNLVEATALMSGKTKDFILDCNMEEISDLFLKCILVNVDFFTKRLLPSLSVQVQNVTKVIRSLGMTTSKL